MVNDKKGMWELQGNIYPLGYCLDKGENLLITSSNICRRAHIFVGTNSNLPVELSSLNANISVINNFWTAEECSAFITKSEKIGYEAATIDTEKGQKIMENVRNNNRVIYQDLQLAEQIWEKLHPYAPEQIGNSKAVGLNELFRFYRYQAGQEFKKHRDQSFIRNDTEASYYTFMIYLNDNYLGGETSFNDLSVQPETGSALIFLHDLEHEGRSVIQGTKYVLRSDIMFKLVE